MDESTEPQTPEEEAALRELDAKHRRRHRPVALLMTVITSTYITVILATTWHDWPLTARDLGFLIFFACNGLFSTCWMLWGPWQLGADAAMKRRWRLQNVRLEAETRAWHQQWAERRGQPREGEAR